MPAKQVKLSLTVIEAHAVYSALKGLDAGHARAEKAYGKGHTGRAGLATKNALAKVELALEDVEQLKGI